MLKVKDKRDPGTLTIKVIYHQFNKEEQLAALEAEKKIIEEKKIMREQGFLGSSLEAVEGALIAGSGVSSGARVGRVGRAVSRRLSKAGRLVSRTITRHGHSKESGPSTLVNDILETGDGAT